MEFEKVTIHEGEGRSKRTYTCLVHEPSTPVTGPDVLFFHGFETIPNKDYNGLIRACTSRRFIIPEFHRSTPPVQSVDEVEDLALALFQHMREPGLPYDLVAYSLGGLPAMLLASMNDEFHPRPERLVLISNAFPAQGFTPRRYLFSGIRMARNLQFSHSQKNRTFALTYGPGFTYRALNLRTRKILGSIENHSLPESPIRSPTLWLPTRNDEFFRAKMDDNAISMEQLCPDLTTYVMDGSHAEFLIRPGPFIDEILRFFATKADVPPTEFLY